MQKLHKVIAPFEIKALDEAGHFSGYASVYNNVDLGGDIIRPGAFKEIVRNPDGKVVVLLMHQEYALPIGVAQVTQDDHGLAFDGQLVMDDPEVKRVYAHMRAKSLNGMSIGYSILPKGAVVSEDGTRELIALKLWEISPVIFGMNPAAGITSVKTRAEIGTNIREFEKFLREQGGFSRDEAVRIASSGFKAHSQASESLPSDSELANSLHALVKAAREASLTEE